MEEASGFWGHFYTPFLEQARAGGPIQPIKLSEYLRTYPPEDLAHIETGAWNVASTSGVDFSQWNGSDTQKEAVREVAGASRQFWRLRNKRTRRSGELGAKLDRARQLILEAETSCFLFWGDSWVPRVYDRTGPARDSLAQVERASTRRRK